MMDGQLKNGTILTSECGNKYKVSCLLGAGGQGEVYDVVCDGQHYALKWYFKGSATERQKKILESIIAKGSPDDSFLWPMELIVPAKSELFGYIMPLRPKNYKSIVDLMKKRVNPSFYSLCKTAFNLTRGYQKLHAMGAKYQDISFGNLFFDPDNGDVLICDNDNVSFDDSKPGGVLGTPGFMAPEVVRGEKRPSRDTDRYSLAVLLFYLFMVNHPLEGKLEASIKCMDMAARVKLYGTDPVFIFDPDNKTNRPVKGIHDNANIYWPLYPEKLRQMFTKSFTEGLTSDRKNGTIAYDYFNLTDELIMCDHKAEDALPKCCDLSENYYIKNQLVFNTKAKVYRYIDSALEQGIYEFDFRYNGKEKATKLSGEVMRYILKWMREQGHPVAKVVQSPNDLLGICKLIVC